MEKHKEQKVDPKPEKGNIAQQVMSVDEVDKKQQQQIDDNKKKVNLSLIIAILALIVSGIQLIISSPQYLDSYNTPKLLVEEYYRLDTISSTITTTYYITNSSHKTAENIQIRLRGWNDDYFQFLPNIATLVKDDKPDKGEIPIVNYTYLIENLVPKEYVILIMSTSIENYCKSLDVTNLKLNETYTKPFSVLAPEIESVKSDKQVAILSVQIS